MNLYKYTFRIIKDVDGNFIRTKLELLTHPVVKETNSGYWIRRNNSLNKKWVPKKGKNIFAFTDKKDALNNFIHRKKRQIGLMTFNLSRIKEAKILADNLIKDFDINQ